MNPKRNSLVEVTWHDAHSDGGGWGDADVVASAVIAPYVVRSVGFLIGSDKRGVVVAQSRAELSGRVTDTMTIPRGMVRRVRRLV